MRLMTPKRYCVSISTFPLSLISYHRNYAGPQGGSWHTMMTHLVKQRQSLVKDDVCRLFLSQSYFRLHLPLCQNMNRNLLSNQVCQLVITVDLHLRFRGPSFSSCSNLLWLLVMLSHYVMKWFRWMIRALLLSLPVLWEKFARQRGKSATWLDSKRQKFSRFLVK